MADIGNSVWNETDASNTTAAPDGAPEGMNPGGVNDVLRAHQGAVKRFYNWQSTKITGGTSTAYTLSYSVAPGALVDGMRHIVQFNATCGAAPTLNINSLGAKPLYAYKNGSWQAVSTGEITANMVCDVAYDSTSGAYRILTFPASAPKIVQSFLTLNTALNNTGTFFNGPNTGSIGAAGETWLIIATALLSDLAGAAQFTIQIHDGSSAIATTLGSISASSFFQTLSVNVVVTLSAATTFTLKANDSTSINGVLFGTNGAITTPNTSITAIRIS